MKAQVHKRKIYIKPRPKEYIKQGLVVILNKPLPDEKDPFIYHDIGAGIKEYQLPELPKGYWVKEVFVRDAKRKKEI